MEKTTWRDQRVLDFVRTNAVVVRVDVDAHKDIAIAHHVQSIPTLVVYNADQVAARHTGFLNADDLIALLERGRSAAPESQTPSSSPTSPTAPTPRASAPQP
jgi:thioredoxin-like negative regulator of GroEL